MYQSKHPKMIRLGMLHMAKHEDLDYIGFLDADLSTDLSDFDDLVSTIENSDFKIKHSSLVKAPLKNAEDFRPRTGLDHPGPRNASHGRRTAMPEYSDRNA